MKKTLGLFALSFGILATGCAMVTHTSVAPLSNPTMQVGMSGPGTITITNLPVAGRGTQAVGTTAKTVVARVYIGDPTNGDSNFAASASAELPGSVIVERGAGDNKYLVATGSVTAGTATLTLPALPAGHHVIRVDAYDMLWNAAGFPVNLTTGVDTHPSNNLVAQSETAVTTVVGFPYSATFPIYNVVTYKYNPNASASIGATPSLTISSITTGASGYYVRLANWNPYLNTANASIRLIVMNTTAWAANLASSSTAATWIQGDMRSQGGYSAPQAFGTGWTWNATRTYMYNDINFPVASRSLYTSSVDASGSFQLGDSTYGSLSLRFPATFFPAGSTLQITDLASGSSQTGSPTL